MVERSGIEPRAPAPILTSVVVCGCQIGAKVAKCRRSKAVANVQFPNVAPSVSEARSWLRDPVGPSRAGLRSASLLRDVTAEAGGK
jgi:hypothetical protein